MQSVGLWLSVLLVGLTSTTRAVADSCEELDPKKTPASIFIACISEQAKEISKLKTQLSKLEKLDGPLDDYILKVFLTEIAKEKASQSEYAAKINEELRQGRIKEAFKLFSASIGQEIDMLDKIKVGYHRPTTVQLGSSVYRTIEPIKAEGTDFGILVSRGQRLELMATLLRYNTAKAAAGNPGAPVDLDPGFPAVNLMVQCTGGCKRVEVPMPAARSASDFGVRDLTEEIDWESGDSAISNIKFVEFKVVPKPPPGVLYMFSAKFVVLVRNPIPQPKTSQ